MVLNQLPYIIKAVIWDGVLPDVMERILCDMGVERKEDDGDLKK